MTECDYVIVGAGSAGCVLAARLSEDAGRTVLLAEAGGRDWNPLLHIPLGSGKLLRRGLHGWKYVTEPNPGLGGRRLPWTRGRVLGGSSAINGMVYVRGHPSDYDGWAMRGNEGWSFRDVLPYFRRAEGHRDRSEPDWGTTGPLGIARAKSPNPLYEAFIRAGGDAGYPVSDDIGRGAEGFGRFDFNIVDGRRCSAARAYLAPVRSRVNLAVRTGHQATRILFEDRRAVGVEFATRGGRTTVRARREVIVCGGTANSPQLLMLSGVGEADHLRALGIPVVHELTGVGKNLQDHVDVPVRFAIREALSLHALIRIDRIAVAMIEAVVRRTGPATSFPTEAGAFLRSSPDAEVPDLQIHFSISLGGGRVRVPPFDRLFFANPLEREGFQIRMCVLRPKSRGEIRLASADAFAKPLIVSNCLSDGSDLELLASRRRDRPRRGLEAEPRPPDRR
ncbi:MAG TPA: GMC family oxidoreductase N-terminal domain-containing protein, partial [Microvirga sp.]|nr:GMC family oxidoreductase N-terminal domain-containing protein [Microvirga sp.]